MKNNVSFKLLILLLLLFFTLFAGMSISISVLAKLKDDAKAVNTIGYIRGSTQRLIQDISIEQKQIIIDEINLKFNDIDTNYIPKNKDYFRIFNFLIPYNKLKSQWPEFTKNILDERIKKDKILLMCEENWENANTAADTMENISNIKYHDTLLIAYALGGFIFLVLLLVFFLIRTEVKNKLEISAIQDPLTNLYNRIHLSACIAKEIKSFSRSKYPFSILFIDIDEFKTINDNFGHTVGDHILKSFADLLSNILREDDIAFRYGGEEFVVLAKYTAVSQAYKLAERIRKKIEIHDFHTKFSITISLGVHEYKEGDTHDDIINYADNMMYQAKSLGRNRTCLYQDNRKSD